VSSVYVVELEPVSFSVVAGFVTAVAVVMSLVAALRVRVA
jgi:hypothetical protein